MATNFPTATGLGQQFSAQIAGKNILITGPSPASIAAQLAIAMASHKPNLLILAGRSAAKLDETTKAIKQVSPSCATRNLIVDFSSLESVRKAAKEVNEYAENVDVSFLSAGIMAPPYRLTHDGFESSFGTNHLSHFLFINDIMGKIQAAAMNSTDGARIVVVSSDGHAVAGIGKSMEDINFNGGKTYNQWRAYGQSKTANILFAVSLSDKLSSKYNIQSYALHPGVIMTSSLGDGKTDEDWADFMRVREEFANSLSQERRTASTNTHTSLAQVSMDALRRTADEGAATMMVAGFDPSIKAQTGGYLQDCRVDPNAVEEHASSREEAQRLWEISERCVGEQFRY